MNNKSFILVIALFVCIGEAFSQKLNVITYRRDNPFLGSQWYLGPRAGANMSNVAPINRFSVLTPNNTFDTDLYNKSYGSESAVGSQYGVQLLFQFSQRFMVVTMPTFVNQRFTYSNEIRWEDSNVSELETVLNYRHQHRFNFIELPLLLRFEIKQKQADLWNRYWRKPKNRSVTPYIQAGPFLDFSVGASKIVSITQAEQGIQIPVAEYTIDVGNQLSAISGGLMFGGGAKIKISSFYINAEANYKLGLNNVVNPGRRYANPLMVNGVYDVFDDMRMSTLEINLGVLIPLKYLTPGNALPLDP